MAAKPLTVALFCHLELCTLVNIGGDIGSAGRNLIAPTSIPVRSDKLVHFYVSFSSCEQSDLSRGEDFLGLVPGMNINK